MSLKLNSVNYKDSSSWTSLIDMVYPKGSVFLGYNLMDSDDKTNSNHPGNLFGGQWLPIEDKMLRSGWGNSVGGSNSHRHYLSTSEGDSGTYGGWAIAAIGASNYQLHTLGYQAVVRPALITNPNDSNAWGSATDYHNKTLYNAFLPSTDTPEVSDSNVSRYTLIGSTYTEDTRILNHGVRVFGWTSLSEYLPLYQTVNTWYRTS